MHPFVRLALALAVVCGLAAGALAYTYDATRDAIARREAVERTRALDAIFFHHAAPGGGSTLRVETLPETEAGGPIFALYAAGDKPGDPSYYAASGAGRGYNASVPIETLAAFTAPGRDARALLAGYVDEDGLPPPGAKGLFVVGWRTVKSQETPGLGEKIREQTTQRTWAGILSGSNPPESIDRDTPFQRQFRGKQVDALRLRRDGGEVEALTAATYTTHGVVAALAAAAGRVHAALPPDGGVDGAVDAATGATPRKTK